MTRRLFSASTLALLLMLPASLHSMAAEDPAAFINNLGIEGIRLLGADVPPAQRIAGFQQLFHNDFDVPDLGRFVLGRYWREITPVQQQDFLRLFEEFTAAEYSERFGEYRSTPFRVTGYRVDADETTVTSELRGGNGRVVEINWHVIDRDDQHKVMDVDIDRVSMKVTERDEFAGIIQRNNGQATAILAVLREELGITRS
jgi:phospholipid transport system substrate-binding protein